MPRIDRSEFVREFNHAKKSLGLTDWETKIDHLLSNWNLGECTADSETKEAEISFFAELGDQRRETIVHELLHLTTAKLRDEVVERIQRLVPKQHRAEVEKILWEVDEEIVASLEEPLTKLVWPNS